MLKLLRLLFGRKKEDSARIEPAVFETRLKDVVVVNPPRVVIQHKPPKSATKGTSLPQRHVAPIIANRYEHDPLMDTLIVTQAVVGAGNQHSDAPSTNVDSDRHEDSASTHHHRSDDSHHDTGASDYSSGSDSSSPSD